MRPTQRVTNHGACGGTVAGRLLSSTSLKIATWNVNSLNVRLPRLLQWLPPRRNRTSCACRRPSSRTRAFRARSSSDAGYAVHFSGQSTYNGVALLVRDGLRRRRRTSSPRCPASTTQQKRVIAATVAGIRVIGLYVPNGQSVDSDKYRYKLDWCARRDAIPRRRARAASGARGRRRLQHCARGSRRPRPGGVAGPGAVLGAGARGVPRLGRARPRRQLPAVPAAGAHVQLVGLPSARVPEEPRAAHRPHPAVARSLPARCTSCRIDRNARKGEKPSDHAPVIVETRRRGRLRPSS